MTNLWRAFEGLLDIEPHQDAAAPEGVRPDPMREGSGVNDRANQYGIGLVHRVVE